jgi:hypothetical protein
MRRLAAIGLLVLLVLPASTAAATPIGNDAFARTWAYTDQPVADGTVQRTWMWGPQPFTGILREDSTESPGGKRDVQYFDKSRMEITTPGADQSSPWYVTNGLLAQEMITGKIQTGNTTYTNASPATINVAGDADDPTGPTYAIFEPLLHSAPITDGASVISTLTRTGVLPDEPALASYGVTAAYHVRVPGIDHQVASPFWDFMNSTGTVYQDGSYREAPLFQNPFYATGYPISEAYWSSVKVAGSYQLVLMQCFERRCLTYTPGNSAGFETEAGNVGQHYYIWRYGSLPPPPPPPPPPAITFGDGVYMVGTDIPADTYRNDASGTGCYWERLSGFGGTLDEIIANDFTNARSIVTIEPSDTGFSSDRCGTWSNDLSPVTASQTAPFGDGTYIVGSDISAGTWRNSDSSAGCYWERLSGFHGTLDDILGNSFSNSLQIVTISPGDVGFHADGCGTWTKTS